MEQNNLKIIGTNHISKESVSSAKKIIETENPDIVAVELDRDRLPVVLDPSKRKRSIKMVPQIGLKGYIFSIVGEFVERYLGKKTGVLPGEEMATAIRAAKAGKKQLELIDQPIQITLKRFSKKLSWKEKWNFVADILKAGYYGITGRVPKDMQKLQNFDLNKVPTEEVIASMIENVKERYPNIYSVLISERDSYMAQKLATLMMHYPDKKIVAFVGAGHKKGILKELEKRIKKNENGFSFGYSVDV